MTLMPDRRGVAVTFPYSVVGVPKGCRVKREVFTWGETSATIDVARPECESAPWNDPAQINDVNRLTF
jgi:hypothetical protein